MQDAEVATGRRADAGPADGHGDGQDGAESRGVRARRGVEEATREQRWSAGGACEKDDCGDEVCRRRWWNFWIYHTRHINYMVVHRRHLG
jgi:hypothetical protein